MRSRERVMLTARSASHSEVGAGFSRKPKSLYRRSLSGAETLLDLQRTHGNAFVQRLVRRKLAFSPTGDRYEQDADRVADAVVRKEDSSSSILAISPHTAPGVQRMCTKCEEEMQRQVAAGSEDSQDKELKAMRQAEEEQAATLQRQVPPGEEAIELQAGAEAGGAMTANGETEDAIQALQGGGRPLPELVRAYIEPRMGHDFSGVRIHTDAHAAQLARSVNALAFTTGGDIVFGAGQYRPETSQGKRVLAHELTHVVQQTQPRTVDRLAVTVNASTAAASVAPTAGMRVQRLVRRSLLNGCGPGQNPFGGDRRASALLTNSLARIDAAQAARPGDPANADVVAVGDAMRTSFRLNPANDDNWNLGAPHFGLPLIRRRLESARDYIDSVVFTFNCCTVGGACPATCGTCAAGEEAFVCAGEASTITLCPLFWTRGPNQRGRVLTHEVLHINFGFINDWGQPDRANAHCYAQFTALVNGFNSPAGFRCH